MTMLYFTYECKVDSKGRILLPSGLKKELSAVLNEGFVIKRSVFFKCLELYPKAKWMKELEIIDGLDKFDEDNLNFIRTHIAWVKPVELDGNGRIQIPKEFIAFAEIDKNIVISSQVTKMEIWNKSHYDNIVNESAANYGTLAKKVMGGIIKPGE
jgi:MraZ protein